MTELGVCFAPQSSSLLRSNLFLRIVLRYYHILPSRGTVSRLASAFQFAILPSEAMSESKFDPPLEVLYSLAGEAAGNDHSHNQQSHTPLLSDFHLTSFALIAPALTAYIL